METPIYHLVWFRSGFQIRMVRMAELFCPHFLVKQGVDYFNGSGWSCTTPEGSTACIGGIGGTMIGSNMTLGVPKKLTGV